MTVTQFAKINVLVRDVHSAAGYVREVLGGETVTPPHPAPFGEAAIVRVHGLVIELIQPSPGSPMAATMERRGPGIDSIGFATEDVALAAGHLEEKGARLVRPGDAGLAETIWVHPKNPLGMSIELFASTASTLFDSRPPSGTGPGAEAPPA